MTLNGLTRIAALALLLWAGAAHAQTPPLPPQTPFLRIAAEAHTQVVNRLAIGPAGRIAATVSDDKTIRIWQADTGEALATLRVPIGPGNEGALYAVAISPDGKTLLAGGHTGEAWDGKFSIYVFDLDNQRLLGRFPDLPGPINHIAYSPDGSRFAVALGGGAGVRLFDTKQGAVLRADQDGFTDRATWVAFDRSGRFAITGFDGEVRLYAPDGARLARRTPVAKARPYAVAFAPVGDLLAIGYSDQARVEIVSARDLSPRTSLRGTEPGGLGAVAWAADGRLFAAGSVRNAAGAIVVRSWTAGGKTRGPDWPAGQDTVFQIEPAQDGGLFLASADPAFTRLAADGRTAFRKSSPGLDFRDLADQHLAVSQDGRVVELRTKQMTTPWRIDMAERTVAEVPGRRALTPVPAEAVSPGAAQVANWKNTETPTIDGRPVRLENQELSRSFTVTPDQRLVVIGTDYALKVFRRDGQPSGAAPLPAAAWAIRVAGDGRSLVAAVGDGTLRWFGIDANGALTERVALFLAADMRRWVAWTTDGLFDHADRGGKDLVGVQLNRARGQPPDWISFAQAYRLMYAPDAVTRRLRAEPDPQGINLAAIAAELRGVRTAAGPPDVELVSVCWNDGAETCRPLAQNSIARGIRRQDNLPGETSVDLVLPPGITTATLRYKLGGPGAQADRTPGPVDVFVNGRNAGRSTRGIRRDTPLEQSIPIDAGLNQIYLRAYNAEALIYAQSRIVQIRREADKPIAQAVPDAGKDGGTKPKLYVLAVGIDKYRGGGIGKLNFAVADARSVADKLRANVPKAYGAAEIVHLYDEEASADAVTRALKRIAGLARSEDTVLIYLSGHGISVANQYYFVTQNVANAGAIQTAALAGDRIVQIMSEIHARNAMLFLDTCYAANFTFSIDTTSKLGHESGRYVLAASSKFEEALDAYDEHNGVFATAVLRGMNGLAARTGEKTVNNFDLGLFVAPLVGKLASEKQHSQTARFKIAADDAQPFSIVDVGEQR